MTAAHWGCLAHWRNGNSLFVNRMCWRSRADRVTRWRSCVLMLQVYASSGHNKVSPVSGLSCLSCAEGTHGGSKMCYSPCFSHYCILKMIFMNTNRAAIMHSWTVSLPVFSWLSCCLQCEAEQLFTSALHQLLTLPQDEWLRYLQMVRFLCPI